MILYDICLSLSDLFHLVWLALGSSMLLQMALFHSFFYSFLWLSSIPLYIYFFIYSSVNGHLGCFLSWLLWIVVLWTLRCLDHFELELCLDMYPGMQFKPVYFSLERNISPFLGNALVAWTQISYVLNCNALYPLYSFFCPPYLLLWCSFLCSVSQHL